MRDARKAFLERVLENEALADTDKFLNSECCTELFDRFERQLYEAWRLATPDDAVSLLTDAPEPSPAMPEPEPLGASEEPETEAVGEDAPIGQGQAGPLDELPPDEESPALSVADGLQDGSLHEADEESFQSLEGGPDTMTPSPRKPFPVQFKLRNGKQSRPYAERVTILSDENVVLIDVAFPAELGLGYCHESEEVIGLPKENGDFSGTVRYRFEQESAEMLRVGKVDVYINPDPTLLWKTLESDQGDPFWKQDEQTQLIQGNERRIVAARKRGRSHAHVGGFCDDDYFVHHDSDGDWYIAVVADGAGSAKFSRHGSRVAVRTAGHHLRQVLGGDIGNNIVEEVRALQNEQDPARRKNLHSVLHRTLYGAVGHAAHKAMKALLDESEKHSELIASVKDLSTTLLAGFARRCDDQWLCAAYWVGDGVVGVYDARQSVELLGEVDSGDYSGQTRFLDIEEVSPEAMLKRTRFHLCDHFTGFILMTDGVSDAKFETEARLQQLDAWDELWTDLETGAELSRADGNEDKRLLKWLDFWSQGNHDDRTIVIIY
ncbi:MAG: protein phosphatase 2C domain-containing protein [Betaproteobacteria bacterium]|nr:protein phosphatase 2C domain-containing protein [Betaproteobacteria bacterium]